MEQLYTAELLQKEKQHQTDLLELQKALQRETKYIEQSLEKQEEMSQQLVKVKRQTVDLSEQVWGLSNKGRRSSGAEKMKWPSQRLSFSNRNNFRSN